MRTDALLRLVPDAPSGVCALLAAARGAVEPPIRSEIFGLQRFAQHGRSLGETHRAERPLLRGAGFSPRLRGNVQVLREARNYIGEQAGTGYDVSPAAEWLLDNFHLIDAQVRAIHADLPRGYFRQLPTLQDAPLAGLPRVYGIAWAFVAHTDGAFDEELLVHFLGAYQETRELGLSELWALPTVLRVVLVESLRRLAERVATNKAAREVANRVCDRLGEYTPARLDRVMVLLRERGVGDAFAGQMALRLQDRAAGIEALDTVAWNGWLQQALPDLAGVQARLPSEQAADNLSVSNAVTSLRVVGDADWADLIARTSTLMRLMLGSDLFAAEDRATRDQTLHRIEALARRSGQGEVAVGQCLLARMHTDSGSGAWAGHWLQGPGLPALLRDLGLHTPALWNRLRAGRWLRLPLYLLALLAGTAVLLAWVLPAGPATVGQAAPSHGWLIVLALLAVFPASEAVVAVINRLISELVPPRHLPRLALAEGLSAEHRVMVVIPALLTGLAATTRLAHRLQLHYLANPEEQAQFALLTDWLDAPTDRVAGDGAALAAAVAEIDALNARYPVQGETPRFLVLHRARSFSRSEGCWIGEERKRGKLEALVQALATGTRGPFLDVGAASRMAPDTQCILTLDSDTCLPPGRLRELIGVAAHPDNQPRLDATGRRVVSGYGILQPRLVTPLPQGDHRTLFHWLFAGQCGNDPYSAATSEVYQDLFDEGTFSGKGLLQVHAVHAVLHGRLPAGQVLSHDLLEGSLARCAAVTDVTLIEEAPAHADVAASRQHRWMRGDWQLLPFLLRPWRYPMPAINRWKMFDNLRRSLVPLASLSWLVLALAGTGVSPWAAMALVLAAFSSGPLLGATAGLAPSRDDVAKRHFYRQAGLDLLRVVGGAAWYLALLPAHAVTALDAVLRALYRLLVSRRHLLQWTTAEAAQARASIDLRQLVRTHWRPTVLAALLMAVLSQSPMPAPGLAVVLCLVWAAAPLWIGWVSRPQPPARAGVLSDGDRAELADMARATWTLFERCVVAGDNHLPPDNLQTAPHDMVAHRTSPTNIGLYLLSAACARRFGWIGTPELVRRLGATLQTMDGLERHRGHFLNWYDTQTCAPLAPAYVSTVDSGNLCGHLLAVGQACRELAASPQEAAEAAALRALAHHCERLGWEADFAFLYHPRRRLLHIGYRVAERQLDAGFYDLLASESRLTSLVAIARGDVPVRHWAALGRPFFAHGAQAGLRSWSGSMFEYLMPTLVLDEPPGSVLHGACEVALLEQIAHGRRLGVPWGMSESAYAASDATLAYQYTAQGVPRLALRRTPADDVVVACYATGLAAQIAPARALENYRVLEGLGARTALGFMEALDFTPARRAGSADFMPVHTYMAHHQGMTIVALANVLFDGVARRWGMGHPRIEAVAPLLQERAPREVPLVPMDADLMPPPLRERRARGQLRSVASDGATPQPTHVLANGRYSVTLRPNGAGTSQWGAVGVHRTRDDALRDAHGSFLYLRHAGTAGLASLTRHPAPHPQAAYRTEFHADRVCFEALWPAVRAHCTVWVSPEDDIEFRQVELHNRGVAVLDLELVSAFEVTLAPARSDEAHPVFSNLFVQAAWRPDQQALLFARTPRLAGEPGVHMAHFLVDASAAILGLQVQTDREHWLGRNHSAAAPRAHLLAVPADAAAAPIVLDTGLDPVCVLAARVRVAAGATVRLTFATAVSGDRDTLLAVVDKYRQPPHVQRASLMSATLSGIRLRELRTSTDNFAAFQLLTTALVTTLHRARPTTAEVCDRRLLWRFGISGDRPLVLVSVAALQGLGLLRSLAHALRWWSWGGIACDLVVVNAEPASYLQMLQQEVATLRDRHAAEGGGRGGDAGGATTAMVLLRAEEISADEMATLKNLARLRFNADGRPLAHHVQEWLQAHAADAAARAGQGQDLLALAAAATGPVVVSEGAFEQDSGDFRFEVHASKRPARPWVNVLANPDFGTQVTEAGGGYSWALNSRMMQLTAWSNDPVADPPSEFLLLQDRRTREVWNVAPGPGADPHAVYRVVHGQGASSIAHRHAGLEVRVDWVVDPDLSVKQVRLRLHNRGDATAHLRVVGLVEWMMGAGRGDRATTRTAHVAAAGATALLCTQREQSGGMGGGTAFFALVNPLEEGAAAWTCDRREFYDVDGAMVLPRQLSGRSGAGLDPCAALSSRLSLRAGASTERSFLLGYAADAQAAQALVARAAAVPSARRCEAVALRWNALLGATTVSTPDPLLDVMVNRWLLYQAVSCRLWAKAGFYQAGGATGFRDQLQDTLALAWAAPQMLREQLLVCAARQFAEGDVQHWWHAPLGAGVRTHFSDDLLWLPHAVLHYLHATADTAVLDLPVPFLEGSMIAPGAEDIYETPRSGPQGASLYEHAARAIDRSLRVGVHGLPLMGSGDWNDGMNRVGIEGRGESVWLGWFLCQLVAGYAPVARSRGDAERALRWEQAAEGWATALRGPAWDGQWFRRAFFDDGQPLGAAANAEGRIDLIAQAWAVLSGVASLPQQRSAMAAVQTHLMDPDTRLVKLLDPPLVHALPSAGYIQAYPPGVRENGGQYSHAGVWALMAQAELAQWPGAGADAPDLPYQTFTWLSPAHRASDPVRGAAYRIEPYVMAGDVYSQPPYAGRGGWSWYTGAAAWMHRAAVESIFGLRLGAHELHFRPCLPRAWPQASLVLRRDGRSLHFLLVRAADATHATGEPPQPSAVLRPGETLAWAALPPGRHHFHIPLDT